MFQLIELYVRIVLKHMLVEPEIVDSSDSSDVDGDGDEEPSKKMPDINGKFEVLTELPDGLKKRSIKIQTKKRLERAERRELVTHGLDLLDLRGPKLIKGAKKWLLAYRLFGQINWFGKPVYLSLLYRLTVLAFMIYIVFDKFLFAFYKSALIGKHFHNPIFLFISTSAFLVMSGQVVLSLKVNSFNLCPMFKILTTPKLCFIKKEVLNLIGSGTLLFEIIFAIYNTLIIIMISKRNLQHFIDDFNLLSFLMQASVCFASHLYLLGISFIDFYLRSAFGFWLLELKSYLEQRFNHLQLQQTRSSRRFKSRIGRNMNGTNTNDSIQVNLDWNSSIRPILTIEEIQRNLNRMDDHLEIIRSVQVGHLLLTSLNAFLCNGAIFLLTYHLLADQSDLYHGFLTFLLGINFFIFIFISYFGDSWLYYTLSSFVQTVEDEYFMQGEVIKISESAQSNGGPDFPQSPARKTYDQTSESAQSFSNRSSFLLSSGGIQVHQQLLIIKKKDVLFCREFLHQFESHLGTPWSKLSLIGHIHMLRAFVTLIAAQIIFNHEH